MISNIQYVAPCNLRNRTAIRIYTTAISPCRRAPIISSHSDKRIQLSKCLLKPSHGARTQNIFSCSHFSGATPIRHKTLIHLRFEAVFHEEDAVECKRGRGIGFISRSVGMWGRVEYHVRRVGQWAMGKVM